MPITAGSLTNVYASLDAYLQASLLFPDGSPVALKLHGVRRFVPPPVDPWIEVHYDFLCLQSTFMNRVPLATGLPQLATDRQGYLQLNCYQLARRFSQRYTTATIRDLVIGAFAEGAIIPVRNYATTNAPATLDPDGGVLIDGIQEHVQDTGHQSGVVQHIVQIQTRYLELYTRTT